MRRAIELVSAGLLLLTACDHGPPPAPTAASAASAASAAPAPTRAPPPKPPVRRPPTCRALVAKGKVRAGSQLVQRGTATDGKTWLQLEPGASVSFRHSVSAREVTLKGPARALPCVGGEEDFLLATGTLESAAGPGARPGAQVTVYTPVGTVSYGDARILVHASKGRVEISVQQGEAWVKPAAGASRNGPETVRAPKGKATLRGSSGPKALVTKCEKLAERAATLARAVLEPGAAGADAGSLGERAAAHLQGRRAARAACWSARAATALAPDAARRDLEPRLERAEKLWRAVGRAPIAPPKPSAD